MPNSLDESFVVNGPWKSQLFKGKVAFVTGGAGTICRAQTEALVLLGCRAAIVGRNKEKTVQAAREISELSVKGGGKDSDDSDGDSVLPIFGVDVREIEQLEEAVARTVERFGRIDFVIAGAAGNFIAPFSKLAFSECVQVCGIY